MKRFMYMAIIAMLFISTPFAFAQKQLDSTAVSRALKNYTAGLQHEVEPVVESAIYNVITVRYHFPEQNYAPVENMLQELAAGSSNTTIRYKAFLALQYMHHPGWFADYSIEKTQNTDAVFQAISQKISGKLLGMSGN